MDIINLRSDTSTLPTPEMIEYMSKAPLGDDTYDDDPTVKRLEKTAADIMGMEDAIFVISGTMGNLIALMVHAAPGDEVILDKHSHIYAYEGGGLANIAGLMPNPIESINGIMNPKDVETAVKRNDIHFPKTKLLCLENSHNLSGGCVLPLDKHRELCRTARKHGLSIHLDGARIFNASIAAGVKPSQYTESVDSIMFCLSKGLSCPLGSILAGSKEFIKEADRVRKRLGGGMRQAGVIAAAGIIALDSMIDRLEEDHKLAGKLAEELNNIPGISVNMSSVQTNMVVADHEKAGLTTDEMIRLLKEAGLLASSRPPYKIRLVVHRHHTEDVIEEAVKRIREVISKNSII